ncbi:MAG: metallophosphoesterase [Candidatus Nanoarchaeia archaeon]|nr:metallophosphoesterase [Candidatus Haiyanarchaeum thermophilum]MCW1303005.1 metallophosphoesterase [Candidatus Haiyanarchaeum thermophilum]MCW1303683.1 metallophosphoesterase [Candidatus Haiyanarchaeum thermophilum]MCW1306363.1 metallophosphoesterase [Candidatus Haiyanarchaeum thermophilum]MCW1307127.1 metallophosphoesterase [Candidatus Haiyanarchaeum thermophilum]
MTLKVLAASDIHGDLGLVKKLAKKARKEKVDVIILCGDITLAETNLEGLVGPLKQNCKKLILVPGNHESVATANFLATLYSPGVYNLHGYAIRIGDVGFFGVGLSNIGIFQFDESEVEQLLESSFEKIRDARKKIMVTHTPPYGTKLDNLGFFVGSIGIRRAVKKLQPDLVLCGHIHETFGKVDRIGKSRIINVGRKGKVLRI